MSAEDGASNDSPGAVHDVVIVMGLPGSGKSSVVASLSSSGESESYAGMDFDTCMPADLKAKMGRGEVISPDERELLIDAVIESLLVAAAQGPVAIAAVLPRDKHRTRIRDAIVEAGGRVTFVSLEAPLATLKERVTQREGHFFNPDALDALWAANEELSVTHVAVDVEVNDADAVAALVAACLPSRAG